MIARVWIVLAGPSLSACFITVQAPADGVRRYELRALEVQVFARDDEDYYAPYEQPVRYEAQFACHSRDGSGALLRNQPGSADVGRFSLPYPADCSDASDLNLAILPSFEHCQAGHIHRDQLTLRDGLAAVDVTIQCDSPTRRVKLQALPLLGCHERETTIERSASQAFRVSGCGRSIEISCQPTVAGHDFRCEHGQVR